MTRNSGVPVVEAPEASIDCGKQADRTGDIAPEPPKRTERKPRGTKRSNYADRIRISVLVNLENSVGWRQGVLNLLKEVPY